ncbi:MAG: XdhC family protein, partial [Oscillospiraceae bacterium]|nr:XdhC family protein [Oscillospiraceae bacterium]
GRTLGTIGGGEVEYRAAQLAARLLEKKQSRFESYQLTPGDVAGIGMICGGDVRVYFQHFDPSDRAAREALETALALLDSPGASWLVTAMDGSGWRMGTYDQTQGLRGLEVPMERLQPLLGSRGTLDAGETVLFAEPLTRAGTVYLFGGGHVARELAHILAMTEFRTVVYDQREQAVTREFFPDASSLLCGPFSEALERVGTVTADDYVVIMTPGHQGDYEVLAQVLRTPAKYIGCIGSRKKIAITRERLLADGFAEADICRVHAPIGLPIGGETPAEVAVSVAAQLIACRSGRLEAFQ